MRPSRLSFVKDPSVADWIAPRLGPFGGQVGSVVPRGFPAYARVLHPVPDHNGEPAGWSAVCARTGRVAHALMQWQSISSPPVEDGTGRSASGGMPWEGDEPLVGDLEPLTLAALCRILEELVRLQRLTVGRELKMIELKKEIVYLRKSGPGDSGDLGDLG